MGSQQLVGRVAVERAAALILLGLDPMPRLEMRDDAAVAIYDRAVNRALELRQKEFEWLAQETANRLARALGGK